MRGFLFVQIFVDSSCIKFLITQHSTLNTQPPKPNTYLYQLAYIL